VKKFVLAVLCLFLTGCGVFEIRVQISPKLTPTALFTPLPAASLGQPPANQIYFELEVEEMKS